MTKASPYSASGYIQTNELMPPVERMYPSADLIQHTIRVWEPRLGCSLTEEDARQILENVVGFFRVLHRWDRSRSQAEPEERGE